MHHTRAEPDGCRRRVGQGSADGSGYHRRGRVTPLQDSGVAASKIPPTSKPFLPSNWKKPKASHWPITSAAIWAACILTRRKIPFAADISYRGFVASPLLGLPQGLSTYVNGVRFNEPFGDTVNWDLIPKGRLIRWRYIRLQPSLRPEQFGRAISIKTKTGFQRPSTSWRPMVVPGQTFRGIKHAGITAPGLFFRPASF